MLELILGLDDNLGLPEDFQEKIALKTKYTHDLSALVKSFELGELPLVFIPVGTLPYITVKYSIIAQATLGPERVQSLSAHLITAKAVTLSDLEKVKVGRINPYCTTSYWALLIYLMQYTKQKKLPHFIGVDGFQDLLFKTADKKVDAAMMWDVTMKAHPEASRKTQVLGTIHDLPAPVIISAVDIPAALKEKIVHFKSEDKHALFNGFAEVNDKLCGDFMRDISLASRHFNLSFVG